jgi:PAS domain S-box-containing protein
MNSAAEKSNQQKNYSEVIKELHILQQVTEVIHSSLDLENVFQEITDGVVHSLGYTTAVILTLSAEKKRFEIKTLSTKHKLLPQINKILGFSLKNFSFPAEPELNDTLRSALQGKTIVAKELAEIAYPMIDKKKCSFLQKLKGTKSYIVVPLSVDQELVGGLLITSPFEEVSREELDTLKSLACAASTAIKNAKIHIQSQQAEEELRKSEEKYKFLVNNSKEIILILDRRGKILFANQSALDTFGYSEKEVLGKKITNFLTKNSITKAFYALGREFLGIPYPEIEVQARTKSGEKRYLEVAKGSIPIRDRGKLIGVMISAADITERKKTYEELKSSEEKFKILFDFAPDGFYLNDLKGDFIDGNREAERITGYKREELIGKSFLKLNLLSPGQIHKAASLLIKNALGKPTGPDEFILNRKDGTLIPVEISTFPVKIKGRTLVLGIARDISEHKKAEDALRKSEMLYRALFEHAGDAVFIMNLEGVHITANRKAAEMLGYSVEELVGKSFKEIVAPSEFQKAKSKLQDLLEGQSFPLYERIFRKKDGTEFPVEINVALVRDPEGKPLYIQSIVRDISERKKAEEKIKASLREKEILLREIHHRVKNNMQIISSLHKLQSTNIKDKQAVEILQSTQNRIKSMALIHEKLYQSQDFSRVDLGEYVKSLTSQLFSSYGVNSHRIKLSTDIKDIFLDLNTAIPCGLIINELVSNSLKHAFPNDRAGEIQVAMRPLNGKEIELVVGDNGVGLPQELDFRKTKSLGLHLVTILTEDQLQGTIQLNKNRGTVFEIRIKTKD